MTPHSFVLAALAAVLALSACGGPAAEPAPATAARPASAPAAAAMPASGEMAGETAQPAADAASADTAEPASAAVLPAGTPASASDAAAEGTAPVAAAPAALDAACQAYFERVHACLAKIDPNLAASFAAQNEDLKQSLAEAPAARQAAACQQADAAFAEHARALGCE